MHSVLHNRFIDTLHSAKEILTGIVVDPRLMPSIVSEAHAIKSPCSASTASLRSRDGTFLSHAKSAAMKQTSEDNIQVMVRVRKFVPREVDRNAKCLVEMYRDGLTVLNPPEGGDSTSRARNNRGPKTFQFDHTFWSHDEEPRGGVHAEFSGQEDVYSKLGEKCLDANFEGYNTCIFAYGQTGSGKSYTMMGRTDDKEHRGIIPRVCEDMFERIEECKQNNPVSQFDVTVSYYEIHNEKTYDLLVPPATPRQVLRLTMDHMTKTAQVAGATERKVKSFHEIEAIFKEGDRHRTTASTKMNDQSSRSHAVFTISLRGIAEVHEGRMDKIQSQMRLVDLAGSERASATGATGAQLVEGSNINKSLSTLGRVIKALADNASRKRSNTLVPYRDSVLTRILQNSLGGNSKTAMIACIAPSDYDETVSTLRWASETKKIRTIATQNQSSQSQKERDAEIEALNVTVRRLQSNLVEGAVASERSVREHERNVREQEQRLAEYQRQVNAVTRAMEEKAILSDKKIEALQEENDTLRAHLKLAIDALKNPLPPIPPPVDPEEEKRKAEEEEEEEEERAAKNREQDDVDEAYFEGSDGEGQIDDQANEMDSVMAQLLGDIGLFRRKLGDDLFRFPVSSDQRPAGVRVM